uniref:Uncharacterized protein n=1 Tax=Arundo donax TaxID=35708 RepID=A0A0A9ETL2_ARUDO
MNRPAATQSQASINSKDLVTNCWKKVQEMGHLAAGQERSEGKGHPCLHNQVASPNIMKGENSQEGEVAARRDVEVKKSIIQDKLDPLSSQPKISELSLSQLSLL